MKIYVVIWYAYEDTRVSSVWSTEARAKAECERLNGTATYGSYDYEEHEVMT